MVCEWLGVPLGNINFITGDTDIVSVGGGAHGGRGMRMGSLVIWNASRAIIDKGTRIAAHMLESDPSAVRFEDGRFVTGGNKRGVGLFDVAGAAQQLKGLPGELRGALKAVSDEKHTVPSFPYGTHVCEVEIDPELGTTKIVRYVAVDDVGRAINPLLIDGQIHGGIAQGVGQALFEHVYYEPDTGQLISGSLMDYALPHAHDLPSYTTSISEIPATTHPLGIRPAGESGITPALGTVINAVVDALAEFGVTHLDMPATPEKVWRAIHGKSLQS
jgi:carbon-monoxide dehydrogenase large subunit